MTPLIGRALGPYHMLEQIGQGGMATVYKAYDSARNRYVAVKVLSPAMAQDSQFVHRFHREVEVLRRMEHPHIVPVEDFGQVDGFVYLVMPYLRVGTLSDRMRQSPLSPREGGRLLAQIAGALEYAHQQGIVHRDIKPSNILLDADGNALLSDFGLVQVVDASLSLTGSALIGTPAYISPEQGLGHPVDARSDQYSLGILLFELVTGRKPFDADTPMATVMKHVHEPLPSPRAFSPNLPYVMERVILKATAKDPGERFGSIAEMNGAFQRALAHILDPATPPPPAIEIPKTALLPPTGPGIVSGAGQGRRPWALLAAGLLALALLFVPVLMGVLPEGLAPAGSESGLVSAGMNEGQLTALSGTIQALSTRMADEGAGVFSASDIQTAAAETAMATGFGPGEQGTETPAATLDGVPTGAGGPATASPTPPPPTATNIPTRAPTSSPVSTETGLPSPPAPTPIYTPIWTPSPTPAPSLTAFPTGTPSPWPSPTWTAAASPLPPPTQTPQLPTATPTVGDGTTARCSLITALGLPPDGNDARWDVRNANLVPVRITAIWLDWPSSNEALERVRFGGQTLWTGEDETPPTRVDDGWSEGDRSLGSGDTKELRFVFDDDAALLGYGLEIAFNDQCTLRAGL